MPRITLDHISKSYGPGPAAVRDVSLHVAAGDFMCLLGPSGCGKTTILRLLAGLEHLTTGALHVGDRVVDSPKAGVFIPPERRRLGLVFQSYALWPHMNVAGNVAFGLQVQRIPKAEIATRVARVMDTLGIAQYADRYPSQLSGGQQQRVALARMLAVNPEVLLLDEPLSNLDATLRLEMRSELRRIHQEFGTTIVFVTHDQWEAMTLASTIAVMKDGALQQTGTPDDIYARPVNSFVARFIGNPPINMIDAASPLGQRLAGQDARHAAIVGIRPEAVTLTQSGLPARVLSIMPTGGSWLIDLALDADRLLLSTQTRPNLHIGQTVGCAIAPQDIHLFDVHGTRLPQPALQGSTFPPRIAMRQTQKDLL
ncbi:MULTISPECIES: ABC transporter ATP-binding protein [unclassified Yoonia]|uniref:ABC transporter ATP-binding protein n=1 Tax=unclassified Yoonia TaxID=2629118 RepID=UPI002AFEDCC1|nr:MULTISPECIES: ABC transporter ATP-binding protein [unclassified Yoonia]